MYMNTEEYFGHRWKYLFWYHKRKKKRKRVRKSSEKLKRKEREEKLYKTIAERTKIHIEIHPLRNKQLKRKGC